MAQTNSKSTKPTPIAAAKPAAAKPSAAKPSLVTRETNKARAFFSGVCFLFALGLALSLNLSFWLNRTVFNTGQFVKTTSPLIREPAVQQQVAKVFAEQMVKSMGGPDQAATQVASVIPGATAATVQQQIATTAVSVMSSPQFQKTWDQTISTAQTTFTELLKTNQANPEVNVRDILTNVQSGLAGTQLAPVASQIQLPPDAGVIKVTNTQALHQVQTQVKRSQTGLIVLAVVVVLLVAAGTLLANNRLRALGIFLITLGVVMLIGVLIVTSGVSTAVGHAHNDNVTLASNVWAVLRRPLVSQTELVGGLAAAAGVVLVAVGVILGRKQA